MILPLPINNLQGVMDHSVFYPTLVNLLVNISISSRKQSLSQPPNVLKSENFAEEVAKQLGA